MSARCTPSLASLATQRREDAATAERYRKLAEAATMLGMTYEATRAARIASEMQDEADATLDVIAENYTLDEFEAHEASR
jgi:hypothetical protein